MSLPLPRCLGLSCPSSLSIRRSQIFSFSVLSRFSGTLPLCDFLLLMKTLCPHSTFHDLALISQQALIVPEAIHRVCCFLFFCFPHTLSVSSGLLFPIYFHLSLSLILKTSSENVFVLNIQTTKSWLGAPFTESRTEWIRGGTQVSAV